MDIEYKQGDFVRFNARWSECMQAEIPTTRGIVDSVDTEKGQVTIRELKTHAFKTAPVDTVQRARRTKAVAKHVEEILSIPKFRDPGGRDITVQETNTPNVGEVAVQAHIDELKEQSMAKNGKAKTTKTRSTKARKPKAADLSGIKASDFFGDSGEKFRPGWDAKLAGILKRIIAGVHSADDKRLGTAKSIRQHPKVADSAHFQHLTKAADKALA